MPQHSRRDVLKTTLALTAAGLVTLPDWLLPALAQGEKIGRAHV